MQGKALPGFRDFYPEAAAVRTKIFSAWRAVATRYGFEEYDGPPLETLELYTQKSGPEIVEQLYHFEDKGGRQVALRPEMTPTLARMVGARAQALKKPIRWFSLPQLFRYERQQRGRLREHFQLNVDLIGESGPLADAEIIAVALDILRELGFSARDVRVRVSDRRVIGELLRGLGVEEGQLPAAYAAIDKIEREDEPRLLEQLTVSGLTAERAAGVLALGRVRGLDAVKEALESADAIETGDPLVTCVEALDAMGLDDFVEVDLSIVRGLAYYTGIVFELFDAGRSLRAICGGGRYDNLLRDLGGLDMPAVGFGMGDVVLAELIKDRNSTGEPAARLDAFVVAVTGEDLPEALRLSHALRDQGVRVEYALKQQSIVKQLKIAASRPTRMALILGPDERKAGEVIVRNLETGREERVQVSTLLHEFAWH
jgi:histidyl-tRNA synthetase